MQPSSLRSDKSAQLVHNHAGGASIFNKNFSKTLNGVSGQCWTLDKVSKKRYKVPVLKDGIAGTATFNKNVAMGFSVTSNKRFREIVNPDLGNRTTALQQLEQLVRSLARITSLTCKFGFHLLTKCGFFWCQLNGLNIGDAHSATIIDAAR